MRLPRLIWTLKSRLSLCAGATALNFSLMFAWPIEMSEFHSWLLLATACTNIAIATAVLANVPTPSGPDELACTAVWPGIFAAFLLIPAGATLVSLAMSGMVGKGTAIFFVIGFIWPLVAFKIFRISLNKLLISLEQEVMQ